VYGFQINFDWTDVPGAAYYLIYFKWPNAPLPVLNDVATTSSQYTFTDCSAYVDYGNGQGWQWHVTAVFPDGSRVVSQTGTFNFTDPFQA
jgi:hypothetical protein